MARLPRPHMPVTVQRDACLYLLGFDPESDEIEWDHVPALVLRERTPDGGYIPAANDPRYIQPLRKADHKAKTHGTGATTAGSDVHRAAKIKRLQKKGLTFPAEIGVVIGRAVQKRAKRQIPSRPFEKRHRPMRRDRTREART